MQTVIKALGGFMGIPFEHANGELTWIGDRPKEPNRKPLVEDGNTPYNKAESKFYDEMKKRNWVLTKRGWPDFACFKDNRLILVEVKPDRGQKRIKENQFALLQLFASYGIDCYLWSPKKGMRPIVFGNESAIDKGSF